MCGEASSIDFLVAQQIQAEVIPRSIHDARQNKYPKQAI
jgi:hypothetical protein